MRLIQPDPAAALLGLRAMKTVASAAGAIRPAERAMMEAAQKVILRTSPTSTPCRRSRRPSSPRASPAPSCASSSSTA